MLRALIVDDNSESRYLLECILSAKGFEVVSASNGRDALNRAESVAPDLVLSDILMPVMDGFSFCRQWKQSERFSRIPFVFYTATYTDPKDEEFALSLGADLFVVKPAEPEELVRLVQAVLERKAAGQLHTAAAQDSSDETPYLRQYNEVLIRKLEDKLVQVEKANQGLIIKDFAIASSKAGIAMAELDGRFNYTNAAFGRFWSKGGEGLVGQGLEVLLPDPLERSRVLAQVQDVGHWVGQLSGQDRTGNDFTTLVEIHAVMGPQTSPLCLMISCCDISEQERMRSQLQRAQRLESLSHFAAGIAHDFNNLLTAIFAGLNLAETQPRNGEAAEQQAFITSAFERAKDLTQRLLNFGKGGSLPRKALSVHALVEESCQLALSGSRTKVHVDLPPSLWNVHANATEISQVFCNIIINARQAMQESGTLRIVAANCTIGFNDGTGLVPGNYVTIQFSDSGPGMEASLLERIFEPFFTSKPHGTGLGLAMSHAIVRSFGGTITASSAPGTGATFQVWLPATSERLESWVPPATQSSDAGSGSILVLDDDEQVCWILSRLLQKQGYRVVTATRGEQAIELYRNARAQKQPFALVILDLTVRSGLGGEATLEQLRALDPQVAAVACSGYSDEATSDHVKQIGFDGMLRKPFLAHELYSVVKATIASSRPGAR